MVWGSTSEYKECLVHGDGELPDEAPPSSAGNCWIQEDRLSRRMGLISRRNRYVILLSAPHGSKDRILICINKIIIFIRVKLWHILVKVRLWMLMGT